MRSHLLRKTISTLFLFFIATLPNNLYATHIRAGEIIATRESNSTLTYSFTMVGYTDTESEVKFGSGGSIEFGDGVTHTIIQGAVSTTILGNNIAKNTYTITHTYAAPGDYTVSYSEDNRNEGILNMTNSVQTPFYVETSIVIDPFLGVNASPRFLVPPIDGGAVGLLFIHNPGAYDPNGDSLSYEILIPKQADGIHVEDYLFPNNPSFYASGYANANEAQDGPPTFEIDSISGDLIWDAPGLQGEYNVAFRVNEWRKIGGEWFQLGSVTRDMQIIIEETDNEKPEVIIPDEICVEAGTFIDVPITGLDIDGDDVKLEAFGGPFTFNPPAVMSPNTTAFFPQPHTLNFTWQTHCDQVRERPYEVQFKVTDLPLDDNGNKDAPSLVDIKTLPIRIVGSAPTGLTATVIDASTMQLDWDTYSCGSANIMQIWRRVDTYDFTAEDCEIGIPEGVGYELVGTLDSIQYVDENGNAQYRTRFIDDNQGLGLSPGGNYCYRIVAQYPEPAGGESYASDEACQIIAVDVAIILNVDIIEADEVNGKIYLRWTEPLDIDVNTFPPPYTYEIFQATGFTGNADSVSLGTTSSTDTTLLGLNTQDNIYNYIIRAVSGGNVIGDSPSASSLRLLASPRDTIINLTWEATVPWSNQVQSFPTHEVYRDQMDSDDITKFEFLGNANITETGLSFVDDGSVGIALSDQKEYCYYVIAKGSYGNVEIPSPLLNTSQVSCAQPFDTTPPCTPLSFTLNNSLSCEELLVNESCDFSDFSNKLTWDLDFDDICQDDVRSFNIYFSVDGIADFEKIGNTTALEYTHTGISSFKGYYKIKSVDRGGLESPFSETISNDNCPNFKMPNVFTPNGDNVNDVFTPMNDVINHQTIVNFDFADCPRFVEDVNFKVFDRSGSELYSFNSADLKGELLGDSLPYWDGKTNGGTALPAGVYYYVVIVTFDVLDISNNTRTYNGWVQLLK